MTVPKWLIPVLAVVAAVAVGVTGWLVGIRFAPEPEAAPPPTLETLPVAGPIDPEAEVPEGEVPVSPALGSQDVVVPTAADDARDPWLDGLISDLAAADDPGLGIIEVYDETGPAGASGADGAGDVCAPPEGDAPADCPSGVYGTVLALTDLEEPFDVVGQAWPSDYRSLPAAPPVACPVSPDADGLTAVPFGIGTNAPAEITITYTWNGNPDPALTATIPTTDDERAAWDAWRDRDGDYSEPDARPQHCFVLPDLRPNTAYRMEIDAVDDLGRTASDVVFWVTDGRAGDEPPVRVVPLTDNVLFVSASHRDTESVEMRVALVDPADAARVQLTGVEQCDVEADLLPEYAPVVEGSVSSSYLASHGYDETFTRHTSGSFSVPEGSLVAICIRWFEEDAPSWSAGTVLRQYSQWASSPDRLVPTVSVTGLELLRQVDADAVTVTAATREGFPCGSWTGPGARSDGVELDPVVPICDLGAMPLDRRAALSYDIVVRTSITFDGRTTTNGVVLRLSDQDCRGDCAVPGPEHYAVLLPTVETASGLCGSSFGADCDPPTEDRVAGSVGLEVAWSEGSSNGYPEWTVGASTIVDPDSPPPADVPQLDTTERIEVIERDGRVFLAFTLRADRDELGYRVDVDGDCGIDGFLPAAGGGFEAGDETERYIELGPVCHGTAYTVSVRLVSDGDGTSSLWSADGLVSGTQYWDSRVRTPSLTYDIGGEVTVQLPEDRAPFGAYVDVLEISVDGDPLFRRSGFCVDASGATFDMRPYFFAVSEIATMSTRISYISFADAESADACAGRPEGGVFEERGTGSLPADSLAVGRDIRTVTSSMVIVLRATRA